MALTSVSLIERHFGEQTKEEIMPIPPATAIQLGLMGAELLFTLVSKIQDAKENSTDLGADDILEVIVASLKFAGSSGKVKELSGENLDTALPIVKSILSRLSGLKGLFS